MTQGFLQAHVIGAGGVQRIQESMRTAASAPLLFHGRSFPILATYARLESEARELDVPVLGKIRYDPAVTRAQVERRSVVELGEGPAADDIRALWSRVCDAIG